MAERLIWSPTARNIRKEILLYWDKRNHSKTYSQKLNRLFSEGSEQILQFPFSGVQLFENLYRGKLIKDYYLIYTIKEATIIILFIWDTRKDPAELLKLVRNFQK